MKTEFHALVQKHKPYGYTMQRILFTTRSAAELFVQDFQKAGYKKPLEIYPNGKFFNVVRGKAVDKSAPKR